MSRNPNLREKYLDGERLFKKYIEMGESRSISLLTEWAIFDGMKSSQGKEPTEMGVWKSLWRWASLNKETAWSIVEGHIFGTPKNRFQYTKEQWIKEMIEIHVPTAWQHNTHAKRDKFLKDNGWT